MTNLTDKFDDLQSQLTSQHNALMARLAATNDKLDAIATALGAPPPTATTTLADVLAAIEATNVILGDVHLDTQSIDEKALTIRDTLSDVHLDTQSIDLKLLRIRNAIAPLDEDLPVAAKSSIVWTLYRIMDAINPTWPRPTSVPAQPALDLLLALAQIQLPKLTDIDAAIGEPTGDATTTALGLLSSIQYSNAGIYTSTGVSTGTDNTILALLADRSQDCGCASPNTVPTGCTEPFRSTDMLLIPYGAVSGAASVIVARWSEPLPAGITFGTYFGLVEDNTELHNDDWTGWKVYVSSDQSQFATDPTNGTRYPTNVWLNLPPGARSYSFAVSERGGISVTLCGPGDYQAGVGECETIAVPWGEGSPAVAERSLAAGAYRVTPDNVPGATIIIYYSTNGTDTQSHLFLSDDAFEFSCTAAFTFQTQYGYGTAGKTPSIELCRTA